MSYDLTFWCEGPDQRLPPQDVYGRLLDEEEVVGLVPIAVEDFLNALGAAFPNGMREPNGPGEWFVCVGSESMFEVTWSPTHVIVTMRPLDERHANRLIDIAATFGMALYDPQTGERFASSRS